MNEKTFTALRELDAAPVVSPTAEETARRNILLSEIFASSASPQTRRVTSTPIRKRPAFVWASVGLGALLVGAAAVGTVVVAPHIIDRVDGGSPAASSGPLSAVQLASWTSTPAALSTSSALADQAENWCQTKLGQANGAGGTPTITNQDARGDVASMLYERQGEHYYCLAAGTGTGLWEVVDGNPAQSLAADGILIDTSGSSGNGAGGLTYSVGFVGTDVTAVTLDEPGHLGIVATVANGRWTAWWPTPGDSAHGEPVGTITVTTGAGSTRTVSAASVAPKD